MAVEWPDSRIVKLELKSCISVWRYDDAVTAGRIRWVDDSTIPGTSIGEDRTVRPIGCRIGIVGRSINIEHVEVVTVKVERVRL